MSLLAQIIFNLLLFVLWPLHLLYNGLLIGKKKKTIRDLKLLRSQIDHRIRWDRDVLTEDQFKKLQEMRDKTEELAKSDTNRNEVESFFSKSLINLRKLSTPSSSALAAKEWLELLVVVFSVVMAARALFLQPFKIPTGSMQPTLHGINYEFDEAVY